MKFLALIPVAFLFVSCKQSALNSKLSGSDSLAVEFFVPNTDTIARKVQTAQKHAIDKMIDFVDAKETEQFKCGYDGSIVFYSRGKEVLPILFKYKGDSCRHFIFELDGKMTSTRMKNEAADFLESLEAGNTTY